MFFRAFIDNDKGFRGRVVIVATIKPLTDEPNGDELASETLDTELVLKHPFALRLRCWLAAGRIKRRLRKLAKFNARHAVR